MTDARAQLERLIEEQGEEYSALSRLLGRNPSYIQQYIKRGSPRVLAEADRQSLARYFRVPEAVLGGPPEAGDDGRVSVPRLAIRAAAGAGALGGSEQARSRMSFDRAWLRAIGVRDPSTLSTILVEGDSMTPTLAPGDEILVDGGPQGRLRDGIYVLRIDDALVVKRLAIAPSGQAVAIRADNTDYPSWEDHPLAELDVVGRVIWAGRRIL